MGSTISTKPISDGKSAEYRYRRAVKMTVRKWLTKGLSIEEQRAAVANGILIKGNLTSKARTVLMSSVLEQLDE